MYLQSGLSYDILNAPYGFTTPHKFYKSAKGNLSFVQKLRLQRKLPVHNGCVNSICWNAKGDYILSGSDDQHLCITHGYNYTIAASVQTGHRANIFSAKFLPNTGDYQVVSCSGDGMIIYSDLTRPETSLTNIYNCHFGTTYEIMTVPNDSHTFLSCGEDGTVRWFDLRIKNSCPTQDCKEDILINCRCAVTTLAVNPLTPYHLGVGCSDSSVRIFDRRMLGTRATGSYSGSGIQAMVSRFTVPEFENRTHRITSLSYSPDGSEMLVSYSSDYIYLFDVRVSSSDDNHPNTKVLKGRSNSTSSLTSPDGRCKSCSERPLMKRLRVRGDWSDTGPNARPESEGTPVGEQRSRSLHASLLQRMSDVLTRMFNTPGGSQSANRSTSRPEETESTSSSSSSDHEDTAAQPSTLGGAVEPGEQPYRASSQDEPLQETSEAAGSGLQGLKQELTSQTKEHKMEPVFNLTFSGQGVQSGLISMAEGQLPLGSLPSTSQSGLRNQPTESDVSEMAGSSSSSAERSIPIGDLEDDLGNRDEGATGGDPQIPGAGGSGSLMMDVETWNLDNSSDDEEEELPNVTSRQRASPSAGEFQSKASILQSMESEVKCQREKREQERSQMMAIPLPKVKNVYKGHRNARTMIKEATFWGSEFIMSGSDCGHIFVWDKNTTHLVMILEADHHVVNCLQPHPFDPILASSGIDYDIKLWAPLKETPFFDEERAGEIIERNQVMLEETKDTITVPASFMIRMLASLNHLRSAGSWRRAARNIRSDAAESH